jgi:hypothetical protein
MEYYFEQSNNNTFEKTNGGYDFFKLRIDFIYRKKIKLYYNLIFNSKILTTLLNCENAYLSFKISW